MLLAIGAPEVPKFGALSVSLDPSLGKKIESAHQPACPPAEVDIPEGTSPEHDLVLFGNDVDAIFKAKADLSCTLPLWSVGNLHSVPVAPFKKMGRRYAKRLDAIAGLIKKGLGKGRQEIPFVPDADAATQIFARPHIVDLACGGKAVAFITEFGQDEGSLESKELVYVLQGFSEDGADFIFGWVPVQFTGTFPEYNSDGFLPYAKRIESILRKAKTTQYKPSLDAIEASMSSIAKHP